LELPERLDWFETLLLEAPEALHAQTWPWCGGEAPVELVGDDPPVVRVVAEHLRRPCSPPVTAALTVAATFTGYARSGNANAAPGTWSGVVNFS
jgi:hypothetical protein